MRLHMAFLLQRTKPRVSRRFAGNKNGLLVDGFSDQGGTDRGAFSPTIRSISPSFDGLTHYEFRNEFPPIPVSSLISHLMFGVLRPF